MNKIILRLKSGREFRFECESYSLHTLKLDNSLYGFTYKGGVGECPIWFDIDDIEAIAVIGEECEVCGADMRGDRNGNNDKLE